MMRVQVDELSEQVVKAQAQSNTQSMQETKARTAQAACARKVCYPSTTMHPQERIAYTIWRGACQMTLAISFLHMHSSHGLHPLEYSFVMHFRTSVEDC